MLTRMEELLLLTVWRLQQDAYGLSIRRQVADLLDRKVSVGAVYIPLERLARKGLLSALLAFAFCLGVGPTVAEPALIAVADKAAQAAGEAGFIALGEEARSDYALNLRLTVALSVGVALVLGVFRILKGWPIHYLVIGGYSAVVVLTYFAPPEIVGIAYDSGGVTTSTITVPLVAALGVGLASTIRGRNPMVSGFGLIALASLTPIVFVLIFGMIV